MVGYLVFRKSLKSLEHRNERLNLRKLSLHSNLLKERSAGISIEFRHLMQADFIAFLRAEIEINDEWNRWWPETLLHVGHFHSAFEVFARSSSKAYFDRAKRLIAIQSPSDLAPLFEQYQTGRRKLPTWEMNRFRPAALVGFEHLATRA